MNEFNLFKFKFFNEDGNIAVVIVAARKDLKDEEVLLKVAKDVACNYSEDSRIKYSDELVRQFKDTAESRLLGTFKPVEEEDGLDYFFVLLQKTKRW